jgi:hypothetical protein
MSSFANDEQFSARTIHLAFGDHVISAKAPGYLPARQALTVTDKTRKQIVIALERDLRRITVRPKEPWFVVGAGGALLVAGAAYHLFAYKPIHDRLAADVADPETYNFADYKAHSHTYDVRRDVTIALYATGAATVIVGLVLKRTVFRDHEVLVSPQPGGAVVGVSWGLR